MEHKKSPLEISLEKQGWRYMGNVYSLDDASLRGDKHTNRLTPIPDAEIQAEFLKRGFKKVRVEEAYDASGNPLQSTFRGVYVRD